MFELCMTFRAPVNYNFYYIWDIPAAVFFTLGLYLIYRNKTLLFLAVYALASLNRETFAFLTVVYLLANWHRRSFLLYCVFRSKADTHSD